ncbi:MAG TPA: hypothetical protein VGS22_19245 [Thermoanaerobaculia bacterium]|jgi:hypothetical protein|nr:hypothetical protein [Thermoanaerobaculia bacterium]
MTQHSTLDSERWARFDLDRQILMIGNEMNRTSSRLQAADFVGVRLGYERVLRLVDLTIEVNARRSLRRELLRWRDLAAALYIAAEPGLTEHEAIFRCLLQFTPVASQQIPFVLGSPARGFAT